MGGFDLVENYNIADETINFGFRNLADGGDLYEASTLAAIKSSTDEEKTNLHLNALVHNDQIYFNTNNCMRVFKDKKCSEIVFNVNFEAIIDSFCLSQDGKYLLVCLRNGRLRVILLSDQNQCVFDKYCEDNQLPEQFFMNCFSDDNGFILITRAGKIFRLNIEPKFELKFFCDVEFVVHHVGFDGFYLLLQGTKLACVNLDNNFIEYGEFLNAKRLFSVDGLFLLMDFEGNLFRICPQNLFIYPFNNKTHFKDLQLLSDGVEKIQLLCLIENESKETFLQMVEYPELTVIYNLKAGKDIYLFPLETLNDDTLYILRIKENGLDSELRFQIVYETEPSQKFLRLLKRQQFEEAENFAAIYNLNSSLINKAKAQVIVEKSFCNSEDIDNLIEILNLIEDDDFKIQACVDVESFCYEPNDVRRILNYGSNIVSQKQLQLCDSHNPIPDLLHRFDTWTALTIGAGYGQSWTEFCNCNLIDELILFLENQQIEEAIIIFNRLDSHTREILSDKILSDIIAVINNIPLSTCKPFLATFIPISLSICPSILPSFVKWTHNTTLVLEKRCKTEFPDNAILFVEHVTQLMKIEDNNDYFKGKYNYLRDTFKELLVLMTALKTLKDLKDNFGIQVPISGFLEGPKKFIHLLLNLSLCPEDHSNLIRKFLYKFITQNGLEPNEIFLDEVKSLMQYNEKYWKNVIPSILKCITSVKCKLEAVKYILNYASVPWDNVLREIINESLKLSHPLAVDIKNIVNTESVQIVLSKPKYMMKKKSINDMNEFKFVVKKIIHFGDADMVTDVYMLCDDMNKRHMVNIMLITHFIRIGNIEKAVAILDNNTTEEIQACAQELSQTMELYINNKYNFSDCLVDNFFEISNIIAARLENTNDDYKQITLPLLKSVQRLKKSFNVKTTTDELRNNNTKQRICDEILEETQRKFENQEHVNNIITNCKHLARSLSMSMEDIFIQTCSKCTTYKMLLQLIDKVDLSEFTLQNLCVLMLLLIKQVGTYKFVLRDDDDSFDESLCENDDNEDELFLKGLHLSSKIAAKIICNAPFEDIFVCMNVRWINAAFYFVRNHSSTLTNVLFGDKFHSASLLPSYHTFTAIKTVFDVLTNFISCSASGSFNYIKNLKDNNTQNDMSDKIKDISLLLENLLKEGQLLTAFRILDIVQNSLLAVHILDSNVTMHLQKLYKVLVPKILSSIAANNIIDEDLFYNLILSLDEKEATSFLMNNIRLYKRYPKKYSILSRIGLKLFQHYNLHKAAEVMIDSLITLKWWKKFELKKLAYDSFFKSTPEDRMEFLIISDCLTSHLIEEFCKDYHLNPKTGFTLLLTHVLHNWKVDYEIEIDSTGYRSLHLKNQDDLLKTCNEVIKKVDKKSIFDVITAASATINPYQYETYSTIMYILKQLGSTQDNTKKTMALKFLTNYRRISKPSEIETEYWYTMFPDTQQLDPLSEFRLPFTPQLFTKQVFEIIRPELNLKNYHRWFELTDISPLTINDICSYVVKELVASGILKKDLTDAWVFYPQYEDLVKEIDKCVTNITDYERIASVVYYLVTHIPSGADQVNVAKLCFKYVSLYKEHNVGSPIVEKAFIKVQNKYFSFSATHILHLFKLAEPKYLQMVSQSNNLIYNLYMDERILGKNNMLYLDCPDINKATEALADLFNLEIETIRSGLVENWLSDHPSSEILDSSFGFNGNLSSEEDYLKRVAYICLGTNLKRWQSYLSKLAFGQEAEDLSVQTRVKALKVFTMISDTNKIEEFEVSYAEFMYFIDKLTIVGNMKTLGITLDVDSLEKYNKKQLLNRLVQRAGNVMGIQTMAFICMTYEIYAIKHWEFIIEAAVKYSMITELKSYVKFLRQPAFRYKRFYIKAWQKIIDHLFLCAGNSPLSEIDAVLLDTFLTIQSCPVVYNLSFENAFSKCLNLDKLEYAAVLIQYMIPDKRQIFVKTILNLNRDLSEHLLKLTDQGLWGITYVKNLVGINKNIE